MPWFDYFFLGAVKPSVILVGCILGLFVWYEIFFFFSEMALLLYSHFGSWVPEAHSCTIHLCLGLQEFLAWERKWHSQQGQLPLESSGWLQGFGQVIEPGRELTITNPCVQGSLARASALYESVCDLQGANLENHCIPTPGLVLLPVRHCLGWQMLCQDSTVSAERPGGW